MTKIDYHSIDLGKNAPNTFRAVIEISQDCRNKYEVEGGLLILDRVLHSPLAYPTHYGFIPSTKAKDGDALDALIWSRYALVPLCIVPVRPIGMLKMRDEAGIDNKILTVPVNDPFFKDIGGVNDIQRSLLREISQFFKRYKELEEDKKSKVKGWFNKEEAKECIHEAAERYKREQ